MSKDVIDREIREAKEMLAGFQLSATTDAGIRLRVAQVHALLAIAGCLRELVKLKTSRP